MISPYPYLTSLRSQLKPMDAVSQSSKPAPSNGPIVTVGYYHAKAFDEIIQGLHQLPRNARPFVGTYGYNAEQSRRIREAHPNAVYAPIFAPLPNAAHPKGLQRPNHPELQNVEPEYAGKVPWLRRRYLQGYDPKTGAPKYTLDPDQAIKQHGKPLVAIDPATGKPSRNLTANEIYRWGQEVGRRMRDHLRKHPDAKAWQLDEIFPSTSNGKANGVALLQFFRGVLDGGYHGRPGLDKRPMKGIVHIAHAARLFSLFPRLGPKGQEIFKGFIASLTRASTAVVAETYPKFEGSPEVKARELFNALRGGLRSLGVDGEALLAKLVMGLTPGHNGQASVLNGYQDPKDHDAGDWRRRFMAELRKLGAKGIGQYGIVPPRGKSDGGNVEPGRTLDVFREITSVIKPKEKKAA